MRFVINGMKYDTEKMEKVANVEKWYEDSSHFLKAAFPEQRLGYRYNCELWRSEKGNWLLTHKEGAKAIGEAIKGDEAKMLLMRYALNTYENIFGELPEA